MKIDAPGGETIFLHRRVWVGNGGNVSDAFLRVPLTRFNMEGEFDLATHGPLLASNVKVVRGPTFMGVFRRRNYLFQSLF